MEDASLPSGPEPSREEEWPAREDRDASHRGSGDRGAGAAEAHVPKATRRSWCRTSCCVRGDPLSTGRWTTPHGMMVLAPLPAGVSGHSGQVRDRFVLAQHHQGQVTVPRLVDNCGGSASPSQRQVMRLLIRWTGRVPADGPVTCCGRPADGGLGSRWTTATPCRPNGFPTQIGNDDSPGLATRTSRAGQLPRSACAPGTNMSSTKRRWTTTRGRAWAPYRHPSSWPPINRGCSPIRPPGRRISTASTSARTEGGALDPL